MHIQSTHKCTQITLIQAHTQQALANAVQEHITNKTVTSTHTCKTLRAHRYLYNAAASKKYRHTNTHTQTHTCSQTETHADKTE